MSLASDMLELGRETLNGVFGGTAGTFAQGSNTKAGLAADWTRLRNRRAGDAGLGLDEDESTWQASLAFFASGFSSSSPVIPTPGDTWTVSGEKAWTLVTVAKPGEAYYSLTFRRRRQKGQA